MSVLDKFRLDGKTALVTGARRGIGKAVAIALAEAGAGVIAASQSMEADGGELPLMLPTGPACMTSSLE